VDVPEPDLLHHSAVPVIGNTPAEGGPQPVRIYSGKDRPAGAYAAVRYRDYWLWIDDGDRKTKRALTAIMFFFTLGGDRRHREPAIDHHSGAIGATGGARLRLAVLGSVGGGPKTPA